MHVLIAMDSFKGSLSSLEAGRAVSEGILAADPLCEVEIAPLADGGEGTVDALACGMGGKLETALVMGPLGAPVACRYARSGEVAVIEISGAAGITLVKREELDPMRATTYGVGEAIRAAIGLGCRRFLVGLGGSATNDGGAGMLMALGYRFLDQKGDPIPLGASGLERLHAIRSDTALPELSSCVFRVACDVQNPLCGEIGASAVYGPQKGADPETVQRLDALLEHYAEVAEAALPRADRNFPGAGAAGGLGFAFLALPHATLESGVRIVLEETGLTERVKAADLIVTGEGRLDAQTAMGKAPIGVARIAKKAGKPVIALSGCIGAGAKKLHSEGVDAFFPILQAPCSLEEAMDPIKAYRNLAQTAEEAFRLFRL